MLKDFRAKVARAAGLSGFRFLHVLGGCPPGWRYPTAQSTEVVRLAVESRYFPLCECDHGAWRITYPAEAPRAGAPTSSRRRAGSPTSSPEQIGAIQAHVDERWGLLERLEG